MSILAISGSTRTDSKTVQFLEAIQKSFPQYEIETYPIKELPLFQPDSEDSKPPLTVTEFKRKISECDAVIIATPEYLYNIPAALKSALEWTTKSGELAHKRILAITFTPHPPRGKDAMTSLLFSLKALNAKVVASLDLYHDSMVGSDLSDDTVAIMTEALDMLLQP